jgi:hypothetical protein
MQWINESINGFVVKPKGSVGAKPPTGYFGQLKSITPISLTRIAPMVLLQILLINDN